MKKNFLKYWLIHSLFYWLIPSLFSFISWSRKKHIYCTPLSWKGSVGACLTVGAPPVFVEWVNKKMISRRSSSLIALIYFLFPRHSCPVTSVINTDQILLFTGLCSCLSSWLFAGMDIISVSFLHYLHIILWLVNHNIHMYKSIFIAFYLLGKIGVNLMLFINKVYSTLLFFCLIFYTFLFCFLLSFCPFSIFP